MCGIIGYSGGENAAPLIISTLKKLEYRGYDSSGIALVSENGVWVSKSQGKIETLEHRLSLTNPPESSAGIGHTRWATHGKADERNAHPMVSRDGNFAVVHNGIIENYKPLKNFLMRRGFEFSSDTDSEVVPMLLEFFYNGDVLESIFRTTAAIEGSYALAIVASHVSECVFAVKKNSSLVLGGSSIASFVCSDIPALTGLADKFCVLEENCVARLCRSDITIFDRDGKARQPEFRLLSDCGDAADKEGFPHFMLKEIFSQPKCLANATANFLDGSQLKDDLFATDELKTFDSVRLVGCGSAYHAAVAGRNFLRRLAKIPAESELASEFRYRNPLIDEKTLTVFISQSGETADTLFALRHAKSVGAPTLAVVNTPTSSLAREADKVIHTRAGAEIAVATTKGYTTQVVCLFLLALLLGKARGTLPRTEEAYIAELKKLPVAVEKTLRLDSALNTAAVALSRARSAFFIGRGDDYAAALEGALKLKEISYINANAYAAGELKHGTISLVESGTPVFALATDPSLFAKTVSNVEEVAARGARALMFSTEQLAELAKETGRTYLALPDCGELNIIVLSVALQLLAYHTATALNRDVDRPRNLAKSVTVE